MIKKRTCVSPFSIFFCALQRADPKTREGWETHQELGTEAVDHANIRRINQEGACRGETEAMMWREGCGRGNHIFVGADLQGPLHSTPSAQ